ncbi:hypothetical protein D3C71_1676800 [compost metagenome]
MSSKIAGWKTLAPRHCDALIVYDNNRGIYRIVDHINHSVNSGCPEPAIPYDRNILPLSLSLIHHVHTMSHPDGGTHMLRVIESADMREDTDPAAGHIG